MTTTTIAETETTQVEAETETDRRTQFLRTTEEAADDRRLAARLRIAAAALLSLADSGEIDPHIADQLEAIASDADRAGELLLNLSL